MSDIVVFMSVTLDGVMQAPGRPRLRGPTSKTRLDHPERHAGERNHRREGRFRGLRIEAAGMVQHLKHGKWKTVARVTTRPNGSYNAVGLSAPGRYRASAKSHHLLR